MSFNRYYEKELVELRALGREFAESNPGLAPFFNTPGRDPDVERLLEGFAFLTGRLRQKLDDELPEITLPCSTCCGPIICGRCRHAASSSSRRRGA